MEVLYPRCAGLDVHAKTVVACVRIATGATVTYEHRTVSTTPRGLLELAEWLTAQAVTHVAMEATGVYWKPVWHVLEDHFTLVLANAMHIRNIPGRKSDTNDATWIADLLALGLIRSSFVPPAPIQDLRDLTRTRKQLVRESARHTQRIQKTLEDANVKLTEVISDILGTSGRRHPEGARRRRDRSRAVGDPPGPAEGHARATGRRAARAGHRASSLHAQAASDANRRARDGRRQDRSADRRTLAPFRAAVSLLTTMPGLSETAAAVIIAEIGDDMTKFPSAGHLVSWAGLCPGSMKAPASAARPAPARAHPGSRPPSSTRRGPPLAKRTATSTPNSSGSRAGAAQEGHPRGRRLDAH